MHRLVIVIRKHFKYHIQYVIVCNMQNLLNFDKTLPYLKTLTPMKRPFLYFLVYLIPKLVSIKVSIADLSVVLHS